MSEATSAVTAISDQDTEPDVDKPVLTEMARKILEFERLWWKYAGAKETAMRDKFDMSSTR